MNTSFERSPQPYLRLAGIFYLGIILLGLYGEMVVRAKLVIPGNPAATAQAISGAKLLWRSGITGDLLMHVLDIPVMVVLYLLLRPVNKSLALFATFINLIQTAVLAANKLVLLVPLYLLGSSSYLKAFTPEQLQTASYLSIKAHEFGFGVGLIFFGVACVINGYQMIKSGYVPKTFGVLMQIAGWSYLTNSFAMLLAPSLWGAITPAVLMPALVGESALCLWMITKGVDLVQWQQRVDPASSN